MIEDKKRLLQRRPRRSRSIYQICMGDASLRPFGSQVTHSRPSLTPPWFPPTARRASLMVIFQHLLLTSESSHLSKQSRMSSTAAPATALNVVQLKQEFRTRLAEAKEKALVGGGQDRIEKQVRSSEWMWFNSSINSSVLNNEFCSVRTGAINLSRFCPPSSPPAAHIASFFTLTARQGKAYCP